jgi:NDP-sugar pyrophosphorylase family protein
VSLDEAVCVVMQKTPTTARVGTPRDLLLDLMADRQIRHVPLLDAANHLVDLALLSELVTPVPLPNLVVIMAGGEGLRLRPLTEHTPKPMLPVGDRPLIETTVRRLLAAGLRRIVIATRYRGDQIEGHFGNGAHLDATIEYLPEEEGLGTIGGVRRLLSRADHPLLVMNGDVLTRVPFRALLEFHQSEHVAMTACVKEYRMEIPFGVFELEDGRVSNVQEKPAVPFFINAGIYVLSPHAVSMIPAEDRCDATDLMRLLVAKGEQIGAFPIREYWRDIGGPDDYVSAQEDYHVVFRDNE